MQIFHVTLNTCMISHDFLHLCSLDEDEEEGRTLSGPVLGWRESRVFLFNSIRSSYQTVYRKVGARERV